MFFQFLIGLGIFLFIAGIVFLIPEFGIFGQIWGTEENYSKRTRETLKPLGKILLSIGLILFVSGILIWILL